jgi:hypothetical protein
LEACRPINHMKYVRKPQGSIPRAHPINFNKIRYFLNCAHRRLPASAPRPAGRLGWRPLSFSGPLAGGLRAVNQPPGFDSSIPPGFAVEPVVTPMRGGPLHSLNRRIARSNVPQIEVAAADVRRGCPHREFNGADSSRKCESGRHRESRCQRNCFEFHGRFLSWYVPPTNG